MEPPVGYVSSGAHEADMTKMHAFDLRWRAHRLLRCGNTALARQLLRRAKVEVRRYRIIRDRAHADGYRWPHERTPNV